jgi:predicted nucleotidyltransferase component of viral defense system
MIDLKEIQKQYPESLQGFKRFILREYLQYKILEILANSEFSKKLTFMGGTCLRIVHSNTRFSEDLDFDNFNLKKQEFEVLSSLIKRKLQLDGYQVEMKTVASGAFHCYIKFPGLLFDEGLTGYSQEKILITIDTEPQQYIYKPDRFILNKFDVFTAIQVVPPAILLAQKFYALINRKRKKGRDFFDILFLMKNVRPDYHYLELKAGIKDAKDLQDRVVKICDNHDLQMIALDVAPFLFNPEDVRKIELFPDYIRQELSR